MPDKGCFVRAIEQVSCQAPLSDSWFHNPMITSEEYLRAQEPDVKGMISPIEARRMSKILKRAVATSLTVLKKGNVEKPDAIITGTGKGCIENSEKFLIDMCEYGETGLKPSLFMQSTHNTISSLIAILLKNHGYNNTYSQLGVSFESALLDAWIQLRSGMAENILVGSHDEVTPMMSRIMRKTNPEYSLISETAVSALLSCQKTHSICEVKSVEILHRPEIEELRDSVDEDALLLLGINGNPENDRPYKELLEALPHKPLVLKYKHIFGENYSSSALAFYAAITILKKQRIPDFMLASAATEVPKKINKIIILNHSEFTDWGKVVLINN